MLDPATANKIRLKFMSLTRQSKLNLRPLIRFRMLKQDLWDSSDLTPFSGWNSGRQDVAGQPIQFDQLNRNGLLRSSQ
ncbi:MAG: hypothetical protein DRR11_13080 [Gammaproteobacteria bacterium]|nr:MAG: hypothetical protein DRR11_13080 [Gammaproteobacteria bacterium]